MARAAVNLIGAGAAGDEIIALAAHKRVSPGLTRKLILARAADQPIIARAALRGVIALTPGQNVMACAAG